MGAPRQIAVSIRPASRRTAVLPFPQPLQHPTWLPSDVAVAGLCAWFAALIVLDHRWPLMERWLPVDAFLVFGMLAVRRWTRRSAVATGAALRLAYGYVVALPAAYKESGAFGTTLAPSIEGGLIRSDRLLFGMHWWHRRIPPTNALSATMDSCYLINYALLYGSLLLALWLCWRREMGKVERAGWPPVSRRTALALHQSPKSGRWRRTWASMDCQLVYLVGGAMLVGLFLCYVFFPLLPAITPRLYFPQLRQPNHEAIENWNWYLLSRFSIPSGIFPSGHVAGPSAIAAALLARRHYVWGTIYTVAAVLIAVATVYGNYHFVSDAVAGAFAGICGWALAEAWLARLRRGSATREDAAELVAS